MSIGKGLGLPFDPKTEDVGGNLRRGRAPLAPLHGIPSSNGSLPKIVGKPLGVLGQIAHGSPELPLSQRMSSLLANSQEIIRGFLDRAENHSEFSALLGMVDIFSEVEVLALETQKGDDVKGAVSELRKLVFTPLNDGRSISEQVINDNPYSDREIALATFQRKVESLVTIFEAKSLGLADLGNNGRGVALLGEGQCNTVFKTETTDGNSVVFKATEEAKMQQAGGALALTANLLKAELPFGISPTGSLARNFASFQMAEALGHGELVAKTSPAVMSRERDGQTFQEVGLVMPFVAGESVASFAESHDLKSLIESWFFYPFVDLANFNYVSDEIGRFETAKIEEWGAEMSPGDKKLVILHAEDIPESFRPSGAFEYPILVSKDMTGLVSLGVMQMQEKTPEQLQEIAQHRQECTWLQLIDCLSGQIDRHGNNARRTAEGHLVGIDNDLSFPTATKRPRIASRLPENLGAGFGIFASGVDGVGMRNYGMPPVIDGEMYRAIMDLNPQEIKNSLQNPPWGMGLSLQEAEAAMDRAIALRAMAEALQASGRVIDSDQWATSPTVFVACNCGNCYFHRFSATAEEIEAQGKIDGPANLQKYGYGTENEHFPAEKKQFEEKNADLIKSLDEKANPDDDEFSYPETVVVWV